MTSCYTVDAIQTLPEGYWMATWGLLEALFQDIMSLVHLVV